MSYAKEESLSSTGSDFLCSHDWNLVMMLVMSQLCGRSKPSSGSILSSNRCRSNCGNLRLEEHHWENSNSRTELWTDDCSAANARTQICLCRQIIALSKGWLQCEKIRVFRLPINLTDTVHVILFLSTSMMYIVHVAWIHKRWCMMHDAWCMMHDGWWMQDTVQGI